MSRKEEEKVYLDKAGYEQYLAEIEKLKEDLKQNSFNKSSAHESAVGDGWHDNYAFEEAKRQELMIIGSLEAKLKGLSRIVIIEKSGDEDLIDLGDVVTVKMTYAPDDSEDFTFKLVGSHAPAYDGEVREISVNSPLGKSVYQKRVGTNSEYEVNSKKIGISILDRQKENTIGGKTR